MNIKQYIKNALHYVFPKYIKKEDVSVIPVANSGETLTDTLLIELKHRLLDKKYHQTLFSDMIKLDKDDVTLFLNHNDYSILVGRTHYKSDRHNTAEFLKFLRSGVFFQTQIDEVAVKIGKSKDQKAIDVLKKSGSQRSIYR